MIIKITAFVEIEGHLDNAGEASRILSRELCNFLSREGVEINKSIKKEIKESNPRFENGSFICHSDVLENLRRS